jgi:hypothetical protein
MFGSMPPFEALEVIGLTGLPEANCVPIPTTGSFFRNEAESGGRPC